MNLLLKIWNLLLLVPARIPAWPKVFVVSKTLPHEIVPGIREEHGWFAYIDHRSDLATQTATIVSLVICQHPNHCFYFPWEQEATVLSVASQLSHLATLFAYRRWSNARGLSQWVIERRNPNNGCWRPVWTSDRRPPAMQIGVRTA